MAVVNELVTKFTFQGSLKPLKNFQEDLKGSIVELGKYGLALGATALATAVWANSTLRGAESLVRLSQDTDISIKKLQELEYIAAQDGVAFDNVTSSIIGLSEKIGEAATQGNEDFNRLGISVRDANGNIKSTEQVLGEITQTFKGLDSKQRISFAQKLGIDKRFIGSLSKTDEELTQLSKTANKFGLLTEDQTKQLNNYSAALESMKFGFTAVSRQVGLQFAPTIQALSEGLTDFLAEFGGSYLVVVFGEFFEGIGKLLGTFSSLIEATVGWKVALVGVGAALAIAFPIIPIIAGITLLLTAVEDIITAFEGGESVIADFFKDTFDIDIVKELTAAFEVLSGWLDRITEQFANLLNFSVSKIAAGIASFFSGKSDVDATINQNVSGGALQPLSQSNENNNTTQQMNNQIKIEVKSNDPEAAGLAVSTALNRELENAGFQFGSKGGR